MRPAALLALLLAAAFPTPGCIRACPALSCTSNVDVVAHVPVTPDKLAGAAITFCRNGTACVHGVVGAAPASAGPPDVSLQGSFQSDARISGVVDGFTTVSASFSDSSGGSTTFHDGDSYAITIVDSAGTKLIDVTRRVSYSTLDVSCNGPAQLCYNATIDLYPSSPSGVVCTGKQCFSAVNLKGTLQLASQTAAPISVRLCRNDACSQTNATLVLSPAQSFLSGGLAGALAATFSITRRPDGSLAFDVRVSDDPAGLHDGDAYVLSITSGTTSLVSAHVLATYEQTFPNGAQCDAFPCRSATLTVP